MSTIRIPPVLRAAAGGDKTVEAAGATVGEVLADLVTKHPALADQLFAPDGTLNRFVNVYVNGEDVRYAQELATPAGPADTVIILPAMAGGR